MARPQPTGERDQIGTPPRGLGVLGELITHPVPLRLPEVGDHPRSYGFPLGHPEMHTFLGVPVLAGGAPYGNLYLTDKADGELFTEQDERALTLLADFAGVAIDHARRFTGSESKRKELSRTVAALDATVQIALALGGQTDLDASSATASAASASTSAPGWRSRSSSAASPYGAIVVADRLEDGPRFSDDDVRLLESFAASAATAVATARNAAVEQSRQRIAAAEDERRRWARELHDETLQSLAALRLGLSAARRAKDDPVAIDELLVQAVDQLDGEIATLRALITELRPAALDELGLPAAISALADRSGGMGLEVDVDVAAILAEEIVDQELQIAIYRIVQEALSNARKHGQATRAVVSVELTESMIRVVVRDDGSGFDVSAPARGFGLAGMRERAELLGGTVALVSGNGAGTTVTATLPRSDATPSRLLRS